METAPTLCRHIYVDIVGYSIDRTVEAQVYMIKKLNETVLSIITYLDVKKDTYLLLPTGDGICITLLDLHSYDLHLQFALNLLEAINQQNSAVDDVKRQFQVRIGINENIDNLIIDVNGNKNIAGSGINYAQRIMSVGDGSMIMLGATPFEQLNRRDKYYGKFNQWKANIKHGETLPVFQFIDRAVGTLNSGVPIVFETQPDEVREINLSPRLAFYLVLVHRGLPIFGPLLSDDQDHNYVAIMLYYLAEYINDYFKNSKKLAKGFTGNYLNAINDGGRKISLTTSFKEIKDKVDGLIASDLSRYIRTVLVEENFAVSLFTGSGTPIELTKEGQIFVQQKCKEEMEFLREVV